MPPILGGVLLKKLSISSLIFFAVAKYLLFLWAGCVVNYVYYAARCEAI